MIIIRFTTLKIATQYKVINGNSDSVLHAVYSGLRLVRFISLSGLVSTFAHTLEPS